MRTVTEIGNPFETINGVFDDVRKHHPQEDITILDWLKQNKHPEWDRFDVPTICVFNGEPVLQKDYPTTTIRKGDVCSFCVLAGDPVSIIIAIVVAIVAVAAVLILSPQPSGVGDTPEADPVYSLKGQTNQNKLGQIIPSNYGRIRDYFDYAAKPYNGYEENKQYQFSLLCAGEGEYDIEPISIEDTLASEFQDVTIEIYNPGDTVTLFRPSVETSPEVGSLELFGPNEPEYTDWLGPYVANATETLTDKIQVDVTLPNGLYRTNDEGNMRSIQSVAEFEYQQIDNSGTPIGSWLPLADFDETLRTTTPQRFTLSKTLPEGRYQVRGRRTNNSNTSIRAQDTTIWEAMRSFLVVEQNYGDVTLIAVRALATNNLNDRTKVRFNGYTTRKLPIYDPNTETWSAPTATRNPVWAMCDILRAKYGGELPDQFIDLQGLSALAAIYDSREDHFDWGFDQKGNVWDSCRLALAVGRAVPMLNGSQVTSIRDEDKTIPTASFSPENMIKDSFSWSLSMFKLNDPDGLEVEYLDEDTWKPETILCLIGNDTGLRPEKFKLKGITNRDKAYREGLHMRAKKIKRREVVKFKTGLEGHIPAINSLISVVHDVPEWGASGLVTAQTGNDVTLSQDVIFEDGQNHKIAFTKRDGSVSGPHLVLPIGDSPTNQVQIQGTFTEDLSRLSTQSATIYQFGTEDLWSKLCRVTAVKPSGSDIVEIECTNHDSSIYSYDTQTAPPKSSDSAPVVVPDLPTVTGLTVTAIPDSVSEIQIGWDSALGALNYVVEYSYDNVVFTQAATTADTGYVLDIISDYIYIRVAAINVGIGPYAVWEGSVGEPTTIPGTVQNLSLQDPFVGTYAKIQWSQLGLAENYKVKVYRQADIAVPQVLPPLREVTVSATTYTYSAEDAASDSADTRDIHFTVVGTNIIGDSETPATLDVTNPIPAALTGMASVLDSETSTGGANGTGTATYSVSWNISTDVDISIYKVWGDETSGFTPGPSNLFFEGLVSGSTIVVDKNINGNIPDLYWVVAAVDIWDDQVNYSPEQTIQGTVSVLTADTNNLTDGNGNTLTN